MAAQDLDMPIEKAYSEVRKQETAKIFFPNLDGLRFIAFFAVFLCHSCYTEHFEILNDPIYKLVKNGIFSTGHLGVNFFFVLSGFLITFLLTHEEFSNGKINVKAFYMRRALRIWPLYYGCVIFGFLIFPVLKTLFGQLPNESASVLLLVSFLGNFNNIFIGNPDSSVLSVLWSVGIEEQFYLFWPLLFIIFTHKYKPLMFISIIIGSVFFRFYNANNELIVDLHTLAVISDMALGGLLGWMCFVKPKFVTVIKDLPKQLIILFYIIGFSLIGAFEIFESQLITTFERLILGLFFSFIIIEQNFAENSFYKMGSSKLLSYWGKYTYGLYCLHFIGILITTNFFKLIKFNNSLFHVMVIETLVSLLISMFLSYISFHYFEKKFLKLKHKFAY